VAHRLAVAGLGPRGLEWARLIRSADEFALAAAVDPSAEARSRAEREPALDGVPVVSTLDAIRDGSVDALVVATPADSHAAVATAALTRGMAVLVEKPFVLDLSAGAQVVRLAEGLGLPLMVVQNFRYMRARRTFRRVVRDGVLGRLSEVSTNYRRPTHVVNAGLAALPASALWETGVHWLDGLRYGLDRNVVGVAADVSTAPWSTELRGTSVRVLLEFEGGLHGTCCVSWDSRGHEYIERGQQYYERVGGELGTMHVIQRQVFLCLSGKMPRLVRRGRRAEPEEMVVLRQLASAISDGIEPECSAKDNLQTIAVVQACERSWRDKRWVNPQDLILELNE